MTIEQITIQTFVSSKRTEYLIEELLIQSIKANPAEMTFGAADKVNEAMERVSNRLKGFADTLGLDLTQP